MTSTVNETLIGSGRSTSARYGAEWSLFADWCEATGRGCTPANATDVLAFLADCPAKPGTLARRVAAIDHTHRALCLAAPGRDPEVVAALRVAAGLGPPPVRPERFDPLVVASALERTPVRGWPVGLTGRRDAALLVAVCSLGLSRPQAAALVLDDLVGWAATDQALALRVGDRLLAPEQTTEPGTCPACALARWHRAASTYATQQMPGIRRQMAAHGRREARMEDRHECMRPVSQIPEAVTGTPLFIPLDQHGWRAPEPLSWRSITTIVATRLEVGRRALDDPSWADALDADLVAEPDDPTAETGADEHVADADAVAAPAEPTLDYQTATRRKREAQERMAEVERLLDELDQKADDAIAASRAVVTEASEQNAYVTDLTRRQDL